MDISTLNIASFPAIITICLLFCQVVKATAIDTKWLPVIAGTVGGVLGVLAFKIVPEFPATDVLSATAIGIVSGFASTGINQVYKQLTVKP